MNKKDLSRLKKMKPKWEELNDEHGKLLAQRIKKFMDTENIDQTKIQAELKEYKRIAVVFQKPIVISNIYIGNDYYPKIIIKEAYIFAKENVPPNCFLLPKIYKTGILKYTSKNNSALMVVERRKTPQVNPNKLDFEIIDTKFVKEEFTPYPDNGMTHHDLRYLLKYKQYETTEEKNLGEFTFTFLFDMSGLGKIGLEGISLIKSKAQEELMKLLKSKDEKVKIRFLDKLYYRCFLKIEEIAKSENFKLPEIEWFMNQLEYKKKLKN